MDSTFWDSFDRSADRPSPFSENADGDGAEAKDSGIIAQNLALLSDHATVLKERFRTQLAELASLLSLPENAYTRDALSDFIQSFFRKDQRSTGNMEIILLCLELVRRGLRPPEQTIDDILTPSFSVSAKASERVAYLQNRLTDSAYMRLTAHLQKPRAAYFASFSDVCEEVYHGLCEYCILPIENTENGKLRRFYSLIDKYELKIVTVCDIQSGDGTKTRYALLRHKHISVLPLPNRGGTRFAEFSLLLEEDTALPDVLHAAEYVDLRLIRADSVPLPASSEYRHELIFALPDAEDAFLNTEAFLLYLSSTLPEYSLLGIFTVAD